jgi:DNA polymerase I-like protein with 3'-5' exonuclease and polymerase domains
MSFITLDFETFYDNDTGFKKQNTEEYINDPRFHVIGVGIKVDDGPTQWFTGNDIQGALDCCHWDRSAVLCHNALFDAAILSWRYSVRPAFIYDTLCMARAIHGVDAGGSLAALAQRYALGEKGREVVNAFGKGYHDFTPEELAAYGEYCINDVELTYALFHKLMEGGKA